MKIPLRDLEKSKYSLYFKLIRRTEKEYYYLYKVIEILNGCDGCVGL